MRKEGEPQPDQEIKISEGQYLATINNKISSLQGVQQEIQALKADGYRIEYYQINGNVGFRPVKKRFGFRG